MKLLLTGHQGYLGTVMVPFLVQAGHEVIGLDSGLFSDCLLGPAPQDPPGLRLDLRDVEARHLEGFDAVVHLAALSNDPLGALDSALTYDINHAGSVKLARNAKAAGVERFLYASTCSVYGVSDDRPVKESGPLKPLTPYAISKVMVEADVQELADSKFSPVYLRNATAFGFSPRLRADIVLNNLVGHAVVSGQIRVLSDGSPWRPLVHATDIARAFVAVLDAPRERTHGRALNVGWEENNLTVSDIAYRVSEAVPEAELRILGETGGDDRSYRVDFGLMKELVPGFKPVWTVADGATELAEAYRRFGFDQHGFDHAFTRLAKLKERLAQGSVHRDLRPAPDYAASDGTPPGVS